MPEFHSEPYLHLAEVTHDAALISWGAFYFKTRSHGGWKLVEDRDLRYVHPPRRESIGARSSPYGPARIVVSTEDGEVAAVAATEATNFSWVHGLKPRTRYRYCVEVDGQPWGDGERWDWIPTEAQGLAQRGGRYANEFRTLPDPAQPTPLPFTFMVLGDYGTGIRRSSATRRQREVAEAMQRVFERHDVSLIVTTGDNIYAGSRILGLPVTATNTGAEDDDWFFTFFQPYRYMINRVPVYPCIGNHDTAETEDRDDRDQLLDNLYLRERFGAEVASARASLDPGLFYRVRFGRDVEFICIDTSKEGFFRGKRLFEYPTHRQWLEQTFAADDAIRWRMAFCHHPPFCAGPQHGNTDWMDRLLPLFARGGLRVMFNGHEHNFQHSHHDGIDYLITGAGSKVRHGSPHRFDSAHTVSWADAAHFLLVTIDEDAMRVRAIGEDATDIPRRTPEGERAAGEIVIRR